MVDVAQSRRVSVCRGTPCLNVGFTRQHDRRAETHSLDGHLTPARMMRVPKGSRWENRLVEVKSGANVVLKCEYDGLGRGTPLTRPVMGVPGTAARNCPATLATARSRPASARRGRRCGTSGRGNALPASRRTRTRPARTDAQPDAHPCSPRPEPRRTAAPGMRRRR